MSSNQIPWFETKPVSLSVYSQADYDSAKQLSWQTMFACQISIRPYEERFQFRWGFSPAFLLEEAIDRQKLFVESQLFDNPFVNQNAHRTLALRCISVPNSGVQLGLIAKVFSDSKEKSQSVAETYWYELESTFPYDYFLTPAASERKFYQLTGKQLLENCTEPNSIAQLRRYELPVPIPNAITHMTGLWQTSIRSDEQIWRSLANYPEDLLLNIQLRPANLSEKERMAIVEIKNMDLLSQDKKVSKYYDEKFRVWIDSFINRYIQPWQKYLFLQVHFASPTGIREYIFRSVGSSITRNIPDQSTPGYEIDYPSDATEVNEWANHLDYLEFIRAKKNSRLPRLRELANTDETHAVFRLPYPPEPGYPNTKFISVQDES